MRALCRIRLLKAPAWAFAVLLLVSGCDAWSDERDATAEAAVYGPVTLGTRWLSLLNPVESAEGRALLTDGTKLFVLSGATLDAYDWPNDAPQTAFFSKDGEVLTLTYTRGLLNLATGVTTPVPSAVTTPDDASGTLPYFTASSARWVLSYQASDGTYVGYAMASGYARMWYWREGLPARVLVGPVDGSLGAQGAAPRPRPGATPNDVVWGTASLPCARTIRHLDGQVTDLKNAPWATGKILAPDGGCVLLYTSRGYLAATAGLMSLGQSGTRPDFRPVGWLSATGTFTPEASLAPFVGSVQSTEFKRLSFSTDTRVDNSGYTINAVITTLDGRTGTLVPATNRRMADCFALSGGRMVCWNDYTAELYALTDPIPRGVLSVAPAGGTAQPYEATTGTAVRSRDGRTLDLSWAAEATEGSARRSRRLSLSLRPTTPIAAGMTLAASGALGMPGHAGLLWVDQLGPSLKLAARAEAGTVQVEAYTGSTVTLTLRDVVATVSGVSTTFNGTLKVGLLGVR